MRSSTLLPTTRLDFDFFSVISLHRKSFLPYFQTEQRMPTPLMEKLITARRANAAALNLRQLVLAIFDQEIHSGGRCDTQEVYAKILKVSFECRVCSFLLNLH